MHYKVNEDVVTKRKQNKMSKKKHLTYNTLNKIFTKTYISKKQNTQNKTIISKISNVLEYISDTTKCKKV